MLLAASIRFPHLGINIEKLPKSITVLEFEIAFYGIIIAIGMALAMTIIFKEVKRTGQSEDYYYDLAIFAIISDSDSSMDFLMTTLYTQMFQVLYDLADFEYHGRLPVPVEFIIISPLFK